MRQKNYAHSGERTILRPGHGICLGRELLGGQHGAGGPDRTTRVFRFSLSVAA